MSAQTVQNPVYQRPIVLNGHMTRLGTFTDISSNAEEDKQIELGFSLELDPKRFALGFVRGQTREYPWWLGRKSDSAITIDCEYGFSMRGSALDKESLRLQPRLETSSLRVAEVGVGDSTSEVSIRRSDRSIEERVKLLELNSTNDHSGALNSLEFEIVKLEPDNPVAHRGYRLESVKHGGVALWHFLPSRLSVAYDAVRTDVERVVELLEGLNIRDNDSLYTGALLQGPLGGLVTQVLQEFEKRVTELRAETAPRVTIYAVDRIKAAIATATTDDLRKGFKTLLVTLSPALKGELGQLFSERKTEIREAVRAGRGPQFDLAWAEIPELLQLGISASQRFLRESVMYLGPLRDEPKSIYPLAGALDTTDVGFKGEHTAAVLDTHRNTYVQTIDPSHFLMDSSHTPTPLTKPLLGAVLEWLNYVGVGSNLSTMDRGKLGHELKIATASGVPVHDLTQVGVGVSQVLPILVSALLAEPGACLVFEQPELHLHPRVQTRLADFFVGLTMLGKQCIVETHSEYLITQLRYRAVIAEGDSVSSVLRIYFVEKEGAESSYRAVPVNPFGGIQDWPKGFFDEKERTVAAILRAAAEKRLASGNQEK
jgi:hypothetical protein